jgi:phosphonate transport system ATP-binding protein
MTALKRPPGHSDSLKTNVGPASHQHAVALENISQRYGRATVLDELSLTVDPGQTVAIVGPSGAGKTTLLRIIAGLVRPTTGRAVLHGLDLATIRSGAELSRLVGMVAQQFDLVPNLSTLNNVLAGNLGRWSFAKSLLSMVYPLEKQTAFNALDRVGILDRAYLRSGLLSGGEQQRAAIARVLVQNPAIVLADEPVSSLDPARAEEVLQLLVQVSQTAGKTLVASIHAIELARAHFDRIVGMRNGSIYFDMPTAEVSDNDLADLYDLQGLRSDA